MSQRRRVLILVCVLAVVATAAGAVVGHMLYRAALRVHSQGVRDVAVNRARLIEAVARFDQEYSDNDGLESGFAATLSQIRAAHRVEPGFGRSGEFLLGQLRDDVIVFLTNPRFAPADRVLEVPLDADLAEPMRRALRGESGVAVLPDYRGERVMAAYEPVPVLGAGVVAKVDMSEIRAPFVRAAAVGAAVCVLLIGVGAVLVLHIGNPLVAEVRESEERLRLAMAASGDGLYDADGDGLTGVLSERMYTMLGYDGDPEGRGLHFFVDLLHPDDRARWRDDAEEVRRSDRDDWEGEYRLRAADGSWRHVLSRGRCVERAADGRPLRVVGTHTDVTDLRRAEAETAERSRFLDALLEAIPLPVFYKGTDGRYLGCNEAFADLQGLRREEIIGATVDDVSPPERAVRYRRADEELLATGGSQSYEHDLVAGDGTTRHVLFSKATYTDADGEVAGLIGVITDLTERERTEQRLQETLEMFRRLLEASPLPTVVANEALEAEFISRKFTEVLGYTPDEVSTLERWLQVAHPDVERREHVRRLWIDELIPRVLERGEAGPIETEVVCKSGEHRVIEIRGSAIGSRLLLVASDLTERRRLEEALRRSQRLEVSGRLAGGVAHDFNNLLQAILGNLELAGAAKDDTERAEHLEAIRLSAERAAELTRQMLAFGRRQLLQRRAFDLEELLEGSLEMVRRLLGPAVEVRFSPGAGQATVHADPAQLEQVMANLVLNAREAMPEGGRLEVRTGVGTPSSPVDGEGPAPGEADMVFFEVRDSGRGMAPEVLEKAFEPFFTTRSMAEASGLGLATVYGIVRQHGGAVEAESEPGRGTAIRVFLPRQRPDEEPNLEPPRPVEAEEPGNGGSDDGAAAPPSARTVLLAEDDAMVRRVAVRILERGGYRVLAAADGAEALELYRDHGGDVDLALLDVVMPRLGGIGVATRLRRERPELPVLLASGYSREMLTEEMPEAAGLPIVRKPFRISDLLRRVADVLAGKGG